MSDHASAEGGGAPAEPIYLDYNATTPIAPAVADAMLPFLREHYGNPSSPHVLGARTKAAVERARAELAALIGARAEELVFTSGGSESNNWALKGIAAAHRARGRHIVTSAIEHPAVLEPLAALEREGYEITRVGVEGRGIVDPREVAAALREDTILVSVMHANNEVGSVQPIRAIADAAHARGVLVHTDAAQSLGKIPVSVDELGVDLLTVAGHKLYAPKGVGALYVRSGVEVPPLIHGAAHEAGRRAGTENVLLVVGLGVAARLAREELGEAGPKMRALRDRLLARLTERLGPLRVNGDLEGGLPNTLSLCFRGVDAATLLAEIGDRVAASAGAACHAEGVDLSSVLEAMRVPLDEAMGTLRFSLGRTTSEAEVDRAAAIVADAVERLRPAEGADPALVAASALAADEVRLTRFTQGMGCACKIRPQDLERVLARVPPPLDPDVLVGAGGSDDAAVVKLSAELALVQTLDFFTPIADAPADFGAIAASNALSDVYAMGAAPRFALSIVGFPLRRLPLEVLEQILEGAHAVARDAGIDILGGHSVENPEPLFGLAVTGFVHPERLWTNAGARPGDVLVLTKPLGTGIAVTAAKRGLAPKGLLDEAIATMRALNRDAAEAFSGLEVHACTDVTGFGLLGHALEMARASGVRLELTATAVPRLPGVDELASGDVVPGGSVDNLAHVDPHVRFAPELSRAARLVLADAQTSGGLLVALPEAAWPECERALRERGVASFARVGRVLAPGRGEAKIEVAA